MTGQPVTVVSAAVLVGSRRTALVAQPKMVPRSRPNLLFRTSNECQLLLPAETTEAYSHSSSTSRRHRTTPMPPADAPWYSERHQPTAHCAVELVELIRGDTHVQRLISTLQEIDLPCCVLSCVCILAYNGEWSKLSVGRQCDIFCYRNQSQTALTPC